VNPALFSLLLLLIFLTWTNVYEASHLPFWYDEIFTVAVTRLPSMPAIWRALAHAVDSSPPGFYALERLASAFASDELIAFRLASIAALPIVSLCLFAFVQRRLGSLSALIAAVVPLLTVLYSQYSLEARPYAPMLACLSIAILAWQRASSWWWLTVLGASMAAAVSEHYYAVFALVPFSIAAVTEFAVHGELRARTWIVFVSAVIPLLVFWPLLHHLHETYAAHYFLVPNLPYAIGTYDWYFAARPPGIIAALAVVISTALVTRAAAPSRFFAGRTREPYERPEEISLIAGFIWLPIIVLLGTMAAGGGLVARYAIGGILGLALGIAYASHLLGRTAQRVLLIGLLAALGFQQVFTIEAPRTLRRDRLNQDLAVLGIARDPSLPIVVSDGVDFLPLAYYRSRTDPPLVALIDREAAVRFSGSDSVDLDLASLRDYFALQVSEYPEFARQHERFLLYSTSGRFDWWPARLVQDHYLLQVIARDGKATLYRVARQPQGP